MDFQTDFCKKRPQIWLIAALSVFAAANYLKALVYLREAFLAFFLLAGAAAAADVLLLRRNRALAPLAGEADEEACRRLFDRYARRSLGWLFAVFWAVAGVAVSVVLLSVNSKLDELAQSVSSQLPLLEAAAFFLLKNLLLLRLLTASRSFENEPALRAELRAARNLSLLYWALAGVVFYVFEQVFVLNISAFFFAVYVLGAVVFRLRRERRFVYTPARRPRAAAAAALAVVLLFAGYLRLSRDVWLTQPYINSVPCIYEGESRVSYDDATGVYTVTKPAGDFRVLQLTDIHLGGSVLSFDKDLRALHAVFDLLEATKPDLVVVTGDLCYPVGISSFSFNNTAPVQQFAAFMRNTGIPWAFTYGNHDTERYAASGAHDLNELYKALAWKTSRTLMYPYVQPEITGRNNQVIEIREQDGGIDYALFLIDSNAYTGEGLNKYDYIHDDQVAWYRGEVERLDAEAGRTVPSLIFIHIPLQQYRTAYELWEQGSDEVTYYFGENGEKMIDKVCCSDHPSAIFDTARELGSTKGFFCGHDHYNNMSLAYQGIRLTYGMSIDYLAMPGIARHDAQRGATLIVLGADGAMDVSQVPLSSVQTPEA